MLEISHEANSPSSIVQNLSIKAIGTANDERSSFGGEGLLHHIVVIEGIKTDMNWDEIIPLEERLKLKSRRLRIRKNRKPSRLQCRKRAAAQAQLGAYEGMNASATGTLKKAKGPTPP